MSLDLNALRREAERLGYTRHEDSSHTNPPVVTWICPIGGAVCGGFIVWHYIRPGARTPVPDEAAALDGMLAQPTARRLREIVDAAEARGRESAIRSGADHLPQHHRVVLARLQDAVERDEWRQIAQINEDLQGLADAFTAAIHRAEIRGRDAAEAQIADWLRFPNSGAAFAAIISRGGHRA